MSNSTSNVPATGILTDEHKASLAVMYNSLPTSGLKASFSRKLKEAGINVTFVPAKASDPVITELLAMESAADQQSLIDATYKGMNKAADKAAFVRRLKAASLPMPTTPAKAASIQDSLIAGILASMNKAEEAA